MSEGDKQQGFWVDDWWVQPSLSELERHGTVVQLEPKVMAVLEHLAAQPGEAISREELEDRIWPGTVVGYDALVKAINKLREALGDDKKQPHYIQTISKKGYRLIAPVHKDKPQHATPANHENISTFSTPKNQSRSLSWLIPVGTLVSFIVVILVVTFWPVSTTDEIIQTRLNPIFNSKPTIVVLPFRNISPNDTDDYLADGLTSDLTTNLSKLSGLW